MYIKYNRKIAGNHMLTDPYKNHIKINTNYDGVSKKQNEIIKNYF